MEYKLSPVVASLGRCGSAVLRDNISASGLPKQIPDIRHLKEARPGFVSKTHAYPEAEAPGLTRVLFTYAHPADIILSIVHIWEVDVQGKLFFDLHKGHLGAPEAKYEDLLDKDALGLEKMFDAYMTANYPVLMVKYPDMFNHSKEISDFIERDVVMEPLKPRRWNAETMPNGPEMVAKIDKTYRSLIEKVEAMPSILLLDRS